LGRVLHTSKSKNVILKIENIPKIGAKVVDENLEPLGKVFDILGPVSSPYASVKTKIQEKEKLVGKMLYVLSQKRRKAKNG
jgi:rRNA processing protein Gar1